MRERVINRRLKFGLLVLVSSFIVGAFGASAASAGSFKAESYPARITGAQTTQVVFTGVVGTWKCGGLAMQGELKEESTTLNLTPIYSECSWAGIAATINMEGCTYEYVAGNTVEGKETKIQATMNIRCPAGKEAKLTLTGGCTLRIPEQTGLGAVTAETTVTPPSVVDLQLNITGETYRVENGTFCPNSPANGTYTNGTLSGVERLLAENAEANQLGFSVR
jgi:hypothetical protein